MHQPHPNNSQDHTPAVRRILALPLDPSAVEDLLFWEAWERHPDADPASVFRVAQLRRAHPTLAAAIRKDVASAAKSVTQHFPLCNMP